MKSVATVYKREGKPRDGRGYSVRELQEVALDVKKALRLKIPVDLRRRSSHEDNVEALKTLLNEIGQNKKSEA